jgi:hypothetical protein
LSPITGNIQSPSTGGRNSVSFTPISPLPRSHAQVYMNSPTRSWSSKSGSSSFPVIGDKGFCIGVGEYAGVVDREFPRDNNIFAASVSSERTGVIDWSYSLSRVDWFSQLRCT